MTFNLGVGQIVLPQSPRTAPGQRKNVFDKKGGALENEVKKGQDTGGLRIKVLD